MTMSLLISYQRISGFNSDWNIAVTSMKPLKPPTIVTNDSTSTGNYIINYNAKTYQKTSTI